MDNDLRFSRPNLIDMAREIFSSQLQLKDDSRYSWSYKNFVMMQEAFNYYTRDICNANT